MIEIKEVKTRKDKKAFVNYPIKLYKDCPYYVPAVSSDEYNNFNPKKNPNLNECSYKGFLAYKNGELVGRIAGIINYADNKITGKNYVRFSRIECIDDIEVFRALLLAVANYGKENGMSVIHGPWGFNDTDREGMLTYGFEERSTYSTNYYYPYFCKNIVELGFLDESKWMEMRFKIPKESDQRIARLCERVKEKYGVREVADTMSVKEILSKYGDKFFETFNQGYAHLDGFVPFTDKETQQSVLDQFAIIVNTRYISILIDKNENVAAFGICLPSICKPLIKHKGKLLPGILEIIKSIKKPKELEMALIAVKPEYKNAGLNSIMINRIMANIIEDGVERIESNPMLESNLSIQQQWKPFPYDVVKRRQTYQMEIEDFIKEA